MNGMAHCSESRSFASGQTSTHIKSVQINNNICLFRVTFVQVSCSSRIPWPLRCRERFAPEGLGDQIRKALEDVMHGFGAGRAKTTSDCNNNITATDRYAEAAGA